jgi:hypothetical protein
MKVFVAYASKALRILGNTTCYVPAALLDSKQASADEVLSTK